MSRASGAGRTMHTEKLPHPNSATSLHPCSPTQPCQLSLYLKAQEVRELPPPPPALPTR